MTSFFLVMGAVVLALFVYLVIAMLKPELFP
jgi:K+-transporting ATPase KdpF subunit